MKFEIEKVQNTLDGAADLVVGDRAKLNFVGPRKSIDPPHDPATGKALSWWKFGGEGMWVEVDGVVGPGSYSGWLRNQPIAIVGERGARVSFAADQIVEFKRTVRS